MARKAFFPALIPLLALLACAPDPAREAELARAALDSHRASLAALGQPAPPPAAATTPRPAAPPPATPPRAAAAAARASQFLGASPEALVAALGEPALRRDEGGAAVWLYAAGGCQLDVVFYREGPGLRVAHVQARAGGLAQRTESSCLRDIQAQRRTPAAGGPPAELGA